MRIFFSHRIITDSVTPLLLTLVIASFSNASNPRFDDKLDKAIAKFNAQKANASKRAVSQFERLYEAAKSTQDLSESARSSYLSRIENCRKGFESRRTFQLARDVPQIFEIQREYYTRLHRAFEPINRMFERELKASNGNDETSKSEKLVKRKNTLQSELIGTAPVVSGIAFKGTLTRSNGDAIPWHLLIEQIDDAGNFTGRVEDNPGVAGHWQYRVAGEISGCQIRFWLTENLRGSVVAAQGAGIIAGNQLIAELRQENSRGKVKIHRHSLALNR